MKKIVFSILMILLSVSGLQAQQTGYVNTEKILEKMPEYSAAKLTLDNLKSQYETLISAEYKKVEILYNSYQSQKVNMSEPQRKMKENEIITKERAVKELQQKYFGQDGEMTRLSTELLDPIKEKVNKAVVSVAEELKIIFIFDISTLKGILYSSPKADYTPLVLKKLNIIENQ